MADFFGPALKQVVQAGRVPMAQLNESARRVLYAEFASVIVDFPEQKLVPDVDAGLETARKVEEKSIVLLKNDNELLPL